MTVTRWPHAIQRDTCPYRLVPVPPPWGCVQSRSVSSRMWRGVAFGGRIWGSEASASGQHKAIRGCPLQSGAVLSRRHLTAALAAALLGAGATTPATTFAQSGGAGDDQYQDPF